MRNFIIVLIFFSLTGCMEEKYTDNRPADQVGFINVTREWRDSVNSSGTNETLRGQRLENGVNTVKNYIVDSLQLQFRSWEVRVLDLAADPALPGNTVVSFGMNLDAGRMTEKTRYQSVVFTSNISDQESIHAAIKSLNVGDIVRIDGNFKTLQKTIDIDSYNDLSKSKNVLDNPEFRIELSKIEKL